ncbi:aspartyl/asparaginyl beta-hydroxylase domain-containing protein [Sphingomonas nostoxanthinifaciens]|uniref:aspartyl/asparaginyl beta-hydroxylase domain-containing protein n=1 Tax=Sphingomonas nostoxanthinifaciens TaxID=2872652 RepID=UPI001CC21B64|nr:aspartyl/asparaginyl beta-hydroxylase domain-containing protein [Sphingomonas nostoxanthinifaciens]UAK25200.1 aspartyl/asparaginyl beta-hydroxylase domain-containing protein [Sphingomonas nostoxanthinifaciens]
MATNAAKAEIAGAMAAFRQGAAADARARLERLVAQSPRDPHALHALAQLDLAQGRPGAAVTLLARAAEADPAAPPLWLALARAQLAAGAGPAAEIASLDRAIALDPYLLPALLHKAQAEERRGARAAAVRLYRALARTTPSEEGLPPELRAALAHGRALIAEDDAARGAVLDGAVAAIDVPSRARAYVDAIAGRRRIYWPEPTGELFPFLPACEYFDRALFPWFAELEAATSAIRAEFLALKAGDRRFDPYVQFAPGVPVNQWAALNHSADWGAFFLWKDGARLDANCDLCPQTAAVMERLPLIDISGRGPTVMFSLLEPHTRIPAHTGTTNVRTTVHLPLVVPPGCGFRVGGETREWQEGVAWGFDDTIEHEAWNDSAAPRAILIIDAWNPYLTDAEKVVIRATTAALAG